MTPTRSGTRQLGLALDGNVPTAWEVEVGQAAERAGMTSLWTMENFYLRDGITAATALLLGTSRVMVGAGTLSPFVRHPIVLAVTAARLQELSNGRAALLLGSGTPESLQRMGIPHTAPLSRLRETINIVRDFFSGKPVSHAGRCYHVEKIRLTSGPAVPPPIFLAAIGPKMLELAGELADGVVLPIASPEYVTWARPYLESGARRASRDPSQIVIAANVLAGTDEEIDAPIPWFGIRHLLGFHFASAFYRPVLDATDVPLDPPAIKQAFADRDWRTLEARLPESALRRFALLGTPAEWESSLERFYQAGLDLPLLFFVEELPARERSLAQALQLAGSTRISPSPADQNTVHQRVARPAGRRRQTT